MLQNNPRRLVASALSLVIASAVACDTVEPATDRFVDEATPNVTDRYLYRLQEDENSYRIRFRTRYVNTHDSSVYLYRRCGYGDTPGKRLVWADTTELPISLRVGSCARLPPLPPLELPAGSTLVDEFEFLSYKWSESPMATMTGPMQLEYFIQASDTLEDTPVDLIPLDARLSNVFRIDPP